MENKKIVFTKVNTAELLDAQIPALNEDDVMVETVFSTISCGTERANITGNANIGISGTENPPVVFPRYSGYSSSGIVLAKGQNVKSVEVGDRVAMFWTLHQKINVVPEKRVIKIEDDNISLQEAALFHIGTFPLAAIRKTRLEIGESMMVMGLGILGLLAVQFAHAAGAVPVIAVDPVEERRQKALQYGADYALDPFEENFAEKVKKITEGGVNTAIEVTGVGAGLDQCLDCMARFGRIALLGCTRDKNFTIDYYRKVHGPGITIVGAHTNARPSEESRPGFFTDRDDMRAIFELTHGGRIHLKNIVEEVHSPYDCGQVYDRLIHDRNFPVVVQFDWRNV